MSTLPTSRFTIKPAPEVPSSSTGGERPSHHANDSATKFKNPWDSWRDAGASEIPKVMFQQARAPALPAPEALKALIPVQTPDFGASLKNVDGVIVTWLGHACWLVEFPKEEGAARGVRVLFDPVFSNRCSPSQLMGPARYTPAPAQVEDLPLFDLLVLSHNHYDHLDLPTLSKIARLPSPPHIVLPLNTAYILKGSGFQPSQITELDWWKGVDVSFDVDGKTQSLRVTGAPAQHFTARGLFDRAASLWSSFVIEPLSTTTSPPTPTLKFWFAGDTGYSALPATAAPSDHSVDPSRPVCPAFEEIGQRWGGFDLALIPIGAYEPRSFMSPIHCDPFDAVRIFKDVKAKKAIGMHWGVWRLTTEPADEPPKLLAEARKMFDVSEEDFSVMKIGESRAVQV
ncbi:beta-lactamase superfamily domain-containing protein [Mrakia frigida]|uniref:beta-lactamase superfamily domain-containing protein n=1 Tax=Mrakia frigida TaxID=29902 RepID=UPI003FCBF1E9